MSSPALPLVTASGSGCQDAVQRLTTPRQRAWSLAACAIVLLAFGLRAYLLPDKPIWYDEAISAWTARLSISDIALYQAQAVHPPLHYWLLHLWRLVAGDTPYALRYLFLGFGMLTVPLLYQLGRCTVGRRAGFIAALLLAVSPFHIAWSQQIRMYSLATLLVVGSTFFLLPILLKRRPESTDRTSSSGLQSAWNCPHRMLWAGYALANILALYTLYLAGVVLIIQAVTVGIVVLWQRRWRLLAGWVVASAATALAYAPWLYMMRTYAGSRQPISDPYEFALIWRIYYTILSVGAETNIERYAPLLIPFLLLIGIWLGLAWRDRARRPLAVFLALVLVIPPSVVYAMSLPKTMFYTPAVHARYFVLFLPFYLLLLGWAVVLATGGLKGRAGILAGLAAAAVLAGANAYTLAGDYYLGRFLEDDWESIAATVRAHRLPEDAVLLYPDEDWCIFLYHHSVPTEPTQAADPTWYKVPYGQKVTAAEADGLVRRLAEKHGSLWVVESVKALDVDPEGHITSRLKGAYRLAGRQAFGDKSLSLYSRDEGRVYGIPLAPFLHPERPLAREIAPGLALLGYDQPMHRAATGAMARLALYWQAAPQAADRYRLGLRLMGAAGQAAQARPAGEAPARWPAGVPLRETFESTVTSLMPSGSYRWEVEVQEKEDGRVVASLPLDELQVVRTRQPLPEGAISHLLGANLGGEVELVGYDVSPELSMGLAAEQKLQITLYWRGLQAIEKSYTVFVQLVGEQEHPQRRNPVWAQQDSVPGNGAKPTTGWAPGEVVQDTYTLLTERGTVPGKYSVHVGMYDRATGQRLKLLDAASQEKANHILLGEVVVR